MLFIKACYRIGLATYGSIIRLVSLFNTKAKQWVEGRQQWQQRLQAAMQQRQPNARTWWFHCASLGEFEQGRPLIEQLRQRYPMDFIVLTFFSPSGYEIRKHYPHANYITYLPLDSPSNAQQFIDIVQPTGVIFVKYEFWYYYLNTLHQRHIPTYLISATFPDKSIFFKWYGGLHRAMLAAFQHIFVQENASKNNLQTIGYQSCSVAGDTRTDRVLEIAAQWQPVQYLDAFQQQKPIFIFGSTHDSDLIIVQHFTTQLLALGWKVVVVPHEIDEPHLKSTLETLQKSTSGNFVRYSQLSQPSVIAQLPTSQALLIDSIGLLNRVYHYGEAAYIGGGFDKCVHNVLEAIVYKIPILYGGKPSQTTETQSITAMEIAFALNANDLNESTLMHWAQRVATWTEATHKANFAKQIEQYFNTQKGATQKIIEVLQKDLELS